MRPPSLLQIIIQDVYLQETSPVISTAYHHELQTILQHGSHRTKILPAWQSLKSGIVHQPCLRNSLRVTIYRVKYFNDYKFTAVFGTPTVPAESQVSPSRHGAAERAWTKFATPPCQSLELPANVRRQELPVVFAGRGFSAFSDTFLCPLSVSLPHSCAKLSDP